MLYFFAILLAILSQVRANHFLPACGAGGVEFFVDTVEKCLNLSSVIPSGDCNNPNTGAVVAAVQNCLPKTVYNPTINIDLLIIYRNSSFPSIDRRLYQFETICTQVRATPGGGITPAGPALVFWDFITGTSFLSIGPPAVTPFPIDGQVHTVCHQYPDPGAHPVAIFATDTTGRTSQVEAVVEIRDALLI